MGDPLDASPHRRHIYPDPCFPASSAAVSRDDIAPARAYADGVAVPLHAQPITVVLADDHPAVRRNLRVVLDDEPGVQVIAEAADIWTVLRHVPAHAPQVLVLDLRLPDGCSLRAIRPLRFEVPATEIVVLTMEKSPSVAHRALEAGAVGVVLKHKADSDLPVAVRRAARGQEYVSSQVAEGLGALRRADGKVRTHQRAAFA